MDVDVAVVGAGPYGLSVAAHLRHRGIDTAVIGLPLDTWKNHMPAGMLLKSDGFSSSLDAPVPGWRLGDWAARNGVPYHDTRDRMVLERFGDYGDDFQRALVPGVDERLVTSLRRVDGGFAVRVADDPEFTAKRVVTAVGITHFARLPRSLQGLGERIRHASALRTFDRFAGQRVAVIGGGSSATEVAFELVNAGAAEVRLITRHTSLQFWDPPTDDEPTWIEELKNPLSGLGRGWRLKACADFADAFRLLPVDRRLGLLARFFTGSGYWLRDTVERGADIMLDTTLLGAKESDDEVILELEHGGERSTLTVDHVIAATGYEADLDRLEFLDPGIRATAKRVGSMPALSPGFQSSIPGLYFVGPIAAGSFGPLMRFMVGAEFAAPRVARRIDARARRRSTVPAPPVQPVPTPLADPAGSVVK